MKVDTGSSPDEVKAAFEAWLADFADALATADTGATTDLLDAGCWWRDLLALSWDLGTYHGTDRIAGLLDEHLKPAQVSGVRVVTEFGPRFVAEEGGSGTIEGFFTFETAGAWCRGVARLRQGDDGWRAWTVMTGVEDLKGHERALGERRPTGPRHEVGATTQRNWKDKREAAQAYDDHEPEVVILGAGQGGLALAANLRLMGVDALILEKSARIGDGWRRRYHSLVLHDPVWADHLPYLPFPQSWPIYSPKDKIADWFEFYAQAMELNVWCSAEMTDAAYDEQAGAWTLTVRTEQGERTLRPRNVVLATGAAGEPNIPDFPGRDEFAGTVYHSSQHGAGGSWAGKKAIVVGACNSGHDIAQDLHEAGAEVTLVQRSSTHIISQQHGIPAIFGANFTESGPPTEYADLLASAFPWPLVLEAAKEGVKQTAEKDAELLASLEAVGFQLNDGPDGTGLMGFALAKGGGYYIDVGASGLIASGRIALAQGSGLAEFTPSGIRLADGRELDADLVVLATGYSNMRETARRLFGDGVADRLPSVLGIGEDGEIGGLYRRTGQPGFWFMGGPLAWVRVYSKHLALQITADLHGVRS
ncbi:flavin-containing monooxygenase [Pimelobacter simplex]|uniref:Flavin-containing monooxygenase n=2 Tax=Nocardioides simplex TaxID=2045 RepID=A0A0A1DMS0_NOCSI|nr:NAD(P)/FAD-dependent oxidoreductase [Pimelobacter simplex]AIY16680.1 Flavin-containing monooxygenase [Pimelobacter simplex]GEB15520.1 FAD-dependent oxidoreductase [Pimelobacter simplex]SFM58694.1 putative flavoprotein involved in K+ transport [Pimelobacter simplex]